MKVKEIIKSQYGASLAMLRQAIVGCPDSLWHSPEDKNPFWHITYHAIFYTHFYLHLTEEDFVPWEKHRDDCVSLGGPRKGMEDEGPCSKADILAYLGLCLEQMPGHVDALDLEAESGFYWLPFDKLELQFYNIRHIQQHTGELCERGRLRWIGLG
jgi:hypothetical protein